MCASTAATFVVSRLVSGHRFDCVHIQNSTLAGGVVMGVAAGLDMHPSAPVGIGFVTGVISVLGYKYLTPFLSRFGIQDICGIHNLHGMPGVLGSMVAMWATLGLSYDSNEYEELFPRGRGQAGIQAAATAISIRTQHSHSLLGELLHLLVSTQHTHLLLHRRLLHGVL